ncbi:MULTISPECIES: beta-N-acetylhexosaminidase [unclassified Herbaspirillum]|uniref:beta-N-acetylhexosaminidase n=1 Tax=unclassified Herbaspirillum TaxID=2624150 RepID=UPI001152EE03|nr:MULTISPECIES: beta-N-acetylhexosaminidase [unclassified Herbaspirillum]MBB5392832.1 beta-N-acetylhexosaminidase [Herbaspirillum sp. SJZ102]TQK04521.1 beta-N-acetylhexosaminidase [Herbaspirillum sp. SJZ130]TQK09694.1 beta-N-acetylhexosaminidase [Herbaspirillum sp. SJZ106]
MSKAGKALGPVMLDVVGTRLEADDIKRLQHPLTGGVILFTRNYENRAQLVELTAAIRRARPGILIAVDHEGGRVQRFRTDGFTVLPAMGKLGQAWDRDVLHAAKLATATGFVLASELRACGIDLSFTPVLDLDYGESTVIGARAFHRDPRVVTLLAKSLNHGLALAGMANCGKHFPGHGFVAADSHVAIPVDQRELDAILGEDAMPYDWLGMSLAAVMPAHVIYPKVDKHPAGFSKKWLGLLRQRFAFQGAIFSDDLSMHGASVAGSALDAAQAAIDAGCDVALICNSPDKAWKILNGLKGGADAASAARRAALAPTSAALDWDALQADARYRAARELVLSL